MPKHFFPPQIVGAVKGHLMCRGPLEAPIFEGSAELASSPADVAAALALVPPSTASEAVRRARQQGAAAAGAYDFAPFTSASANFSFTTDDCVSAVLRCSAEGHGRGMKCFL